MKNLMGYGFVSLIKYNAHRKWSDCAYMKVRSKLFYVFSRGLSGIQNLVQGIEERK